MAKRDVKPPNQVKRSYLNTTAVIEWPGAYPKREELPTATRNALDSACDELAFALMRS